MFFCRINVVSGVKNFLEEKEFYLSGIIRSLIFEWDIGGSLVL